MASAPSPGSAPHLGPPPKVATTKQSPVWSPHGSAPAGKRNRALIAVGLVLVLVALGFGSLFAMNLYQYSTVEQRWANDPNTAGKALGVKIVKASDFRRMVVFGPASAVAGVPGFILLVLGLRRR